MSSSGCSSTSRSRPGSSLPTHGSTLAEASLSDRPTVTVKAFGGLAVQAASDVGADFIVKGLRTPSDFDIEQQMAHTNHSVSGVRTVFLPCRAEYGFVSSRFIREIAAQGEAIDHLVAAPVAAALADRFAQPSD